MTFRNQLKANENGYEADYIEQGEKPYSIADGELRDYKQTSYRHEEAQNIWGNENIHCHREERLKEKCMGMMTGEVNRKKIMI